MLTSGASYGLMIVAALLFRKGTTVFVEDPTYFIAIDVLSSDMDMNIVPGKYWCEFGLTQFLWDQ